MKLCDLTHAYTDRSGGIRTYLDAKRDFLVGSTDWEHVLIIPGATDSRDETGRSVVRRIASPMVPGCAPYRMILRTGKILSALREERPDLIELGSPYLMPSAAFHYRQEAPCSVIGFYHTDFPQAYVEQYVRRVLGRWIGRIAGRIALRYTRKTYSRCDATIACSAVFWKKLQRIGVPSVKLLALGVDLNVFDPARRDPALRRALGVARDGHLLVYAGRFDTEKRVAVLAEAMQRLPDSLHAKLALVGEGPMKKQLEEVARITNRLIVLPYRSDKVDLAKLFASADLYVTAGPSETFGLSVLEAQACGLPVVGVRAGALVERVTEETGILGAVDSAEEMAANISTLLRGDLKKMSRATRRKCEASYSWEKTFRSLFDLYMTIHRGERQATETAQEAGDTRDHSWAARRISS